MKLPLNYQYSAGYDDDLAAQATAASKHLRGFLTQIHPYLEQVPGPGFSHQAVLELLKEYPAPADLKAAIKIWDKRFDSVLLDCPLPRLVSDELRAVIHAQQPEALPDVTNGEPHHGRK